MAGFTRLALLDCLSGSSWRSTMRFIEHGHHSLFPRDKSKSPVVYIHEAFRIRCEGPKVMLRSVTFSVAILCIPSSVVGQDLAALAHASVDDFRFAARVAESESVTGTELVHLAAIPCNASRRISHSMERLNSGELTASIEQESVNWSEFTDFELQAFRRFGLEQSPAFQFLDTKMAEYKEFSESASIDGSIVTMLDTSCARSEGRLLDAAASVGVSDETVGDSDINEWIDDIAVIALGVAAIFADSAIAIESGGIGSVMVFISRGWGMKRIEQGTGRIIERVAQ